MVGSLNRFPAIAFALIAALSLLAAATPAEGSVVGERLGEPAEEVLDYWTPARMEAARPAGVEGLPAGRGLECTPALNPCAEEVADYTAPGVSAHGKVYFTYPDGEDASCSGTVVGSRVRSVVWTAGHCVFRPDDPETRTVDERGFVTNWLFVPAYRDGVQPYGQWVAKRIGTTGPWEQAGNIKYDLGAAVVRTDAEGRRLQDVVGARKIVFDRSRDQIFRAFGYPADAIGAVRPEFTGERQFLCVSPERAEDDPGFAGPPTIAIRCDMSAGASGGGWIVGNKLLSVTSYGYNGELDRLYGPYMSATAKALYRKLGGKPKRKGGGKKSGGKKGGGKKSGGKKGGQR